MGKSLQKQQHRSVLTQKHVNLGNFHVTREIFTCSKDRLYSQAAEQAMQFLTTGPMYKYDRSLSGHEV